MENVVFIEVFSEEKNYEVSKQIVISLESVIIYSVYKYCSPDNLSLCLVFSPESPKRSDTFEAIVNDNRVITKQVAEIPWQVSSCAFPIVKHEDTIITGMCGVARHICKYRSGDSSAPEHEEGLLGFRHSCLQAPNEASIWTKFCEIDIIKSTLEILKGQHDEEFPVNLARFENHLKKPVKVHNVYKIARNKITKNSYKQDSEVENITRRIQELQNETTEKEKLKNRVGKNRKWKSASTDGTHISSSTPIDQLDVDHKFAEGPFLTLADLVLYPCYYIISSYYGDQFSKNMINSFQWIKTLNEIDSVNSMRDILDTILRANNIKSLNLNNILTPPVSDVSLYKCDPKRHNPKKRIFTKEDSIIQALGMITDGMELSTEDIKQNEEIDWGRIPSGANPKAGHLPDKRMDRKCQQLENLALATQKVAKKGDIIVDFCSGSGHLGILVAHLLPQCTVVLLENKEQSLTRARARVHEMGLNNVYFFQCNLDFFNGKFDVGLALHACGIASDLVLDKCLKAHAKFIICPCCYGSLHSTDRLRYPRSCRFSGVPVVEYMCIGHAADQTHSEHPLAVRGARCMAVIDSDRARLAEEAGYKVTLSRLKPLSCTPKNNLLIGVPI